ncbi:MAG: aminopeptidase [Clostridiales bacterium]|jgi:aminopeptidase|nr:aminopeptidase [Clostridiales bacterium]
MLDPRISKLAKNLIGYSVAAKRGDRVLIEATNVETPLVTELVKEVYARGAYPYVSLYDNKVQRAILMGADEAYLNKLTEYNKGRMEEMDCYLGIRGALNSYETSDVPPEKMELYSRLYAHPIHHERRVKKTRWVVLRYPNESMSQLAGMSTEEFESYYFNVCNLDYSKMDRAMDALQALMNRTDRVRLTARDTDLSFSIKGIGSKKCSGHMNIPDGEVYSAPVKTSVNGVIRYNAPSIENGTRFEDVRLVFRDGRIVEATANFTEKCNKIFDTDPGARYVGEFAIGVNPYITRPMGDILFDEKISGSVHFTPGACYDDAYNGNESAVHWDLVLIQTPEYGGGQIWFDDVLIRDNGRFVIEELFPLNPENLI